MIGDYVANKPTVEVMALHDLVSGSGAAVRETFQRAHSMRLDIGVNARIVQPKTLAVFYRFPHFLLCGLGKC